MTVLFLTHRLPYAPNRGDRVRAYFLLRYLRERADVHLVSLVHDAAEAAKVRELSPLVSSVHTAAVPRWRNLARSLGALPSARPTTHTMLDSPALDHAIDSAVRTARPDVVVAYCSGMARCALRAPLSAFPLVLDMVDVDSAKWRDLGRITMPPLGWIYRREARVLGAFEALAAARASVTMVVTPREQETLRVMAPTAHIEVVPNGVDLEALRPQTPPSATPNVVFCGVMNYAPNAHAATWLARDIWPLVRARRPDATLTLVGSEPTAAVVALASSDMGIVVTGAVPDVRPYLWNAAVAAAPIVTARGIQNKVLEAVAAGLPTVVTPNIAEALPRQILPAITSAAGTEAIAASIVDLLNQSPDTRRAIAGRADIDALTWERQLEPVERLLRDAVANGCPPDARGTR